MWNDGSLHLNFHRDWHVTCPANVCSRTPEELKLLLHSQVFHLRRPGVFVSDKVEVFLNEKLVSIVRKEATFMTPMFSINDAHDSPTLRVKGEVTDYNFQVTCS